MANKGGEGARQSPLEKGIYSPNHWERRRKAPLRYSTTPKELHDVSSGCVLDLHLQASKCDILHMLRNWFVFSDFFKISVSKAHLIYPERWLQRQFCQFLACLGYQGGEERDN